MAIGDTGLGVDDPSRGTPSHIEQDLGGLLAKTMSTLPSTVEAHVEGTVRHQRVISAPSSGAIALQVSRSHSNCLVPTLAWALSLAA